MAALSSLQEFMKSLEHALATLEMMRSWWCAVTPLDTLDIPLPRPELHPHAPPQPAYPEPQLSATDLSMPTKPE